MNITIQNEHAAVICQTLGAELLSYRTASGKEYLWQKDPAYWAKTSPVLFPYIGAVPQAVVIHGKAYDMPRHGFVKDADFVVSEQSADYVVLSTGATDATRAVFPYEFTFTVTFRLEGPKLLVTYGVINQSPEEMPFLIGGHPAFFCPMEEGEHFTEYLLRFEDEEVEDLHLQYPMFDNDAVLYENLTHRTVKLIHQCTEKGIQFDFPDYLTVAFWTPIKKDAPFLCIEPWCGGTMDQVPNTHLLEKKYVQSLPAGQARDYRFSFQPC
ncbi:MAG: aldose 1-epimerase family protein [Lachnospiraceae bacterium]|nr:aldose 1-epimerase family protein [Lachnospiraceae bacterium]